MISFFFFLSLVLNNLSLASPMSFEGHFFIHLPFEIELLLFKGDLKVLSYPRLL